jgi:uridine kinase
VYSFAEHQRTSETTSIYSPHVLILEGIFALYDPRVLELLDMGVREAHGGTSSNTQW